MRVKAEKVGCSDSGMEEDGKVRLFLYNNERYGLNLEAVVDFTTHVGKDGQKVANVTMVSGDELLRLEGEDVGHVLSEIRMLSAGM